MGEVLALFGKAVLSKCRLTPGSAGRHPEGSRSVSGWPLIQPVTGQAVVRASAPVGCCALPWGWGTVIGGWAWVSGSRGGGR